MSNKKRQTRKDSKKLKDQKHRRAHRDAENWLVNLTVAVERILERLDKLEKGQ